MSIKQVSHLLIDENASMSASVIIKQNLFRMGQPLLFGCSRTYVQDICGLPLGIKWSGSRTITSLMDTDVLTILVSGSSSSIKKTTVMMMNRNKQISRKTSRGLYAVLCAQVTNTSLEQRLCCSRSIKYTHQKGERGV